MKNVAKGSIFGKIILFIVGLMLILIASINILLGKINTQVALSIYVLCDFKAKSFQKEPAD